MVLSLLGCFGLIELDLLFFSRRLSWIPWITSHELQHVVHAASFAAGFLCFLVITSSCAEFKEGPVVTLLKCVFIRTFLFDGLRFFLGC